MGPQQAAGSHHHFRLPACGGSQDRCSCSGPPGFLLDSSGSHIVVGVGPLWRSSWKWWWSVSLGRSQPCRVTESALSLSLCSRVFKTDMELEVLRYTNRISSEAHREVSWAEQ